MLPHLVNLALQLHLVAIIVDKIWVVLCVSILLLLLKRLLLKSASRITLADIVKWFWKVSSHGWAWVGCSCCIVLSQTLSSRELTLASKVEVILSCSIPRDDSETLLVRHRLVFVSKVARLKALHQATILGHLTLLGRVKLRLYSRVDHWHMIFLISSPVFYGFANFNIVRLCQLSDHLIYKARLLLLSSKWALCLSWLHTMLGLLLFCNAFACLDW